MNTVCEKNMCAGCMACIEVCRKRAISIQDNLSNYNAVIEDSKCIKCNLCHKICPQNDFTEFIYPILWQQGWASGEEERLKSSSGGFASAIAKAFVEHGGIVCSCTFKDGQFVFDFAQSESECNKFKGSKYVKSNPHGIYEKIKQYLKAGRSVLVIGLPCQIAGVKKYVGEKLQAYLYTVDLICHGTPSPKLLDMYLRQEFSLNLVEVEKINFRDRNIYGLYLEGESILPDNISDCYTLSFLEGLSYTENCYQCKYARIERISDLTLGDSWGSEFPRSEIEKGISLALCQTEKGIELMKMADILLEDVDLNRAIKSNRQLNSPSEMPKKRQHFFSRLNKGVRFKRAVRVALPDRVIKNDIKYALFKLRGRL